jgi:hypothetical protein
MFSTFTVDTPEGLIELDKNARKAAESLLHDHDPCLRHRPGALTSNTSSASAGGAKADRRRRPFSPWASALFFHPSSGKDRRDGVPGGGAAAGATSNAGRGPGRQGHGDSIDMVHHSRRSPYTQRGHRRAGPLFNVVLAVVVYRPSPVGRPYLLRSSERFRRVAGGQGRHPSGDTKTAPSPAARRGMEDWPPYCRRGRAQSVR